MSTWEAILGIVGMGLITLITRSFFMIPKHEIRLPDWMRDGLRYAPLAALAAVIVPEIVMTQGELIHTWKDARLYATAVATAYFFWRRGILGTIVSGTAVMLALRIGLGW
ncbi:branched-chain amino acid transporter [Roseateles aquatilis]|uniref:Branched-chain amino acid transporter n=1 Tax=Roseateles aquatilis TaxID=431061 RepID=A0A246JCX6_9BURK|nr:AzlD domain-containing protein [Roseateles aquatilis]OWQ90459.1 branched-chain amino acid transporter [Roseateles aquatilis]